MRHCLGLILPVWFAAACGSSGVEDEGYTPASGGSQASGGSAGSGGGAGMASGGSAGSAAAGGSGGSSGGSGGTSGSGGMAGSSGGSAGTGGSAGSMGGSAGSMGGSGGSTGGTGGGTGGTGGGPVCNDPGPENNETEANASLRPPINDCDNTPTSSVPAISNGAGDTDWFSYEGKDDFGILTTCNVNPHASVDNPALRVCAYAACKKQPNNTTVTCKKGSADNSPAGRKGCCAVNGGEVELGVECPGLIPDDDSSTVFMRVDQPNSDSCESYTLSYHF